MPDADEFNLVRFTGDDLRVPSESNRGVLTLFLRDLGWLDARDARLRQPFDPLDRLVGGLLDGDPGALRDVLGDHVDGDLVAGCPGGLAGIRRGGLQCSSGASLGGGFLMVQLWRSNFRGEALQQGAVVPAAGSGADQDGDRVGGPAGVDRITVAVHPTHGYRKLT